MQYLCKKKIEMDKIIGMGNALVDVLATLNDDQILNEMELPKGSMTLIDETKLLIINECFSEMETELATGGSAGNAIRGMACLGAGTGFIGKVGNDFFGDQLRAAMMLNKTEISEDILKETEMLNFANVAASIITTRKGALRVMPEQEEIQQYLKIIRNANK